MPNEKLKDECDECHTDYNLTLYEIDTPDKVFHLCPNCYDEYKIHFADYDIKEISKCPGYYYCEKLDNLRGKCTHEEEIKVNLSKYSLMSTYKPPINWCSAADVSMIKTTVALSDYIKKSEEEANKINHETLKLNKDMSDISTETLNHTKKMEYLTKIMLIVSCLNLIVILLQIIKG